MNNLWKNFIVAVTSALITVLGSYYIYKQEIEIKKIDVDSEFDANYFSKPKFPNSKVSLTVDGDEKNKIGTMKISLVNYSPKNYTDIPVSIKLTPENLKDFKILAYSAVGEKEMANLITEIKPMKFDGKSYNFTYQVLSINRTEYSDYGLQLRILFEGSIEPKIDVVAKGVGTRKFNLGNSPYQKNLNIQASLLVFIILVVLILVTIILSTVVIAPITTLLTRNLDRQKNKKYSREIFNSIKNENFKKI